VVVRFKRSLPKENRFRSTKLETPGRDITLRSTIRPSLSQPKLLDGREKAATVFAPKMEEPSVEVLLFCMGKLASRFGG
jgi:hypothetical protein